MKYWQILTLALLVANASQISSMSLNDKLDETTKKSVKKAAAAALKVAVAAKKAEAAESIKNDMKEVSKTETKKTQIISTSLSTRLLPKRRRRQLRELLLTSRR